MGRLRVDLLGRLARARRPSPLPWARPRYELALLTFVAVAVLLPVPSINPQDSSRMCVAQAMAHGRLTNDSCLTQHVDYATYNGHYYSDKAPGLALLELPAVALFDAVPFHGGVDLRLWAVRALTVGLSLLVCVFLVGRVSEGLAPGFGSIVMVTFALGTIAGSLVQIGFEADVAALALFGAFLLAWAKRPFLAGVAAGAALLIEYDSALTACLLAAYVALAGRRALARYAVGFLPGVVLLGAYDWAAFGAPWHLSYRYVPAQFAADQGKGFFGIGLPTLSGLFAVLGDNGGFLFVSPVLAVAAFGLLRLHRTHPAEATLAACVTGVLLLVDIGYYLPYGGTSPGPRFAAPALPFLALGLARGFAWRPRLALLLAVVSTATATAISLVWASGTILMQNTVWGELARIPSDGASATYISALSPNAFTAFGLGEAPGIALILLSVLGALVVAVRSMPRRVVATDTLKRALLEHPLSAWMLAAVDVCAIWGYPYGNGYQPRSTDATVSVTASPLTSYLGGEVNFAFTVTNQSSLDVLTGVVLSVSLAPGMNLVGPPKLTTGTSCNPSTGSKTVVCPLGYVVSGLPANVYFGVQFSSTGRHELVARVSSNGFPAPNPAVVVVPVGK